jgi:aspartate carbamoyltransferase catalytic subunit
MALAGRDVLSVFDLSDSEIREVMDLADQMARHVRGKTDICSGKVMAALFYEPSTRTRLSFESAMQRLGGDVITCADISSSSVAKGETLADTVRIVESYADVIVMRHPLEGSAVLGADYARAPVVNAGDGAHEHPTQTLLDLYTLRKEHGSIEGAWVMLVGDLKYGRAAHSFAYGLARFKANVVCVAPQGLEMERQTLRRLERQYGCKPRQFNTLEQVMKDDDLLAAAADKSAEDTKTRAMALFDAIYVTRVQKERFPSAEAFEKAKSSYAVDLRVLKEVRADTLVMHPLPRVDELDYGIDTDLRAAYFRQAAYGVPVRMALITAILGGAGKPVGEEGWLGRQLPAADWSGRCANPNCVTAKETYAEPRFVREADGEPVLCYYCERPVENADG